MNVRTKETIMCHWSVYNVLCGIGFMWKTGELFIDISSNDSSVYFLFDNFCHH